MYKIAQAVYQNGSLILSEKLSSELEGKSLKVIILDTDEIETKRERFFQLVDKHTFALPEDYQFNRDELYD
jgi:predicted DNA-binding antitoxin AbrB/MazE fold protein